MMNILDRIIATKRVEVEQLKKEKPWQLLESSSLFMRPRLSLKQWILDPAKTRIIAEFKRKSPSKGVINGSADVHAVTSAYTAAGASGLSVLTDSGYFGGSGTDLQVARENEIPILRKDFIVDEYQVIEARAMGADVVLLIAACLSVEEVRKLATVARDLQLEVLLELHDESELDHLNAYTELVGINNRNLKTFEVDVQKSIMMAERLGNDTVKIAESGINSPADVISFRQQGFDGFLIGERFMREADPGQAFRAFVQQINGEA